MKKIDSPNNPFIHHLVKLRQNKIYRQEKSSCLIVGNKIVNEVARKFRPLSLITSNPFISTLSELSDNIFLVSPEIMKKITGLPCPEELAAEMALPKEKKISSETLLVVLDKIQDPGNLGTLIRTAHGLGWDGVILTEGSCDPLNDKALRSAKGSTFFIPLFYLSTKEIETLISEKKYSPIVTDVQGKDLASSSFIPPLLLILSNESHGSDLWTKKIENKIAIPLKKDIDSLNVAISGAIFMYEILRKLTP